MKRKVFVMFLAVLMVIQCLPLNIMAAAGEYHTVTFYDDDGTTVLGDQYVKHGETPVVPDPPTKEKHRFTGWSPSVDEPVTKDTVYTAVYVEVEYYTITIKYVLENEDGQPAEGAPAPIVRAYLGGETFHETFDTPVLNNWVPDKKSVTISNADLEGKETEIVVTYLPANTEYTIEHWFEKLDGEYELDDEATQVIGSRVGERVAPEAMAEIPAGFHVNNMDAPAELTEGAETVLKVYYDRDINTVQFDACGGAAVDSKEDKYGTEFEVPSAERVGYVFAGWHTSKDCEFERELICDKADCEHGEDACWETVGTCVCGEAVEAGDTLTIPAAPLTTYYAAWAGIVVEYTVVYNIEKQNLGYEPDADNLNTEDFLPSNITFTRKALVNSTVTAIDEDINYQGLTAYAVHGDSNAYAKDVRIASYLCADSVTVNADGSTVLNVYFKRDHFTFVFDGWNSFKRYGDEGDWLDPEDAVHLYFKYDNEPEGVSGSHENGYYSEIVLSGLHYGEVVTDRWPDVLSGTFYIKKDGEFITLEEANLNVSVGATDGSFVFDGWRGVMNSPDPQENVINTTAYTGAKITGRMLCNFNRDGATDSKWRGCLMVQLYPARMFTIVEKLYVPTDAPRNTTGAPIPVDITKAPYSGLYTTVSSVNQSELFDGFDPNADYWLKSGSSGEKSLPHTYGWWVSKITGFEYDWSTTESIYGAYGGSAEKPYDAHYVTVCLCSRTNCGYSRSYTDGKGLVTDDYQIRLMPFLYNRLSYELNFVRVLEAADEALDVSYSVPYETALSWYEPVLTEKQKIVKIDGVTYEFAGWYYDDKYTKAVDWDNHLMPAEGFSLFAKWEPKKIEISFDWNYEGAPDVFTYNIVPNTSMQEQEDFIAVPTRENYVFTGWYETKVPQDNQFDDQQEIGEAWDKRTLYAGWERVVTGYTVQYLLKGSNSVVAPMKTVEGLDSGIKVSENYLDLPDLWPVELSAEITLKEDMADNHIIFYYTNEKTNQYQVFHHYTENTVEKVIAEDPVITGDGRVVEFSGHPDIPSHYSPTEAAKSLILVSDYTKNQIHFYYLPYPTVSYVVHHHYQTNVETQLVYSDYPEDASAAEASGSLRKGYSYVAQRKIRDNYEITNIFVESVPASTGNDLYLTPSDSDMGSVIHIYMYYKLIPTTSLTVHKEWQDDDNRDGIRPTQLTVKLLANGQETGDSVVLSDANQWTATIEDLLKYNGSGLIRYTWSEESVEGYELTGIEADDTATKLTNTHIPETVTVDGTKTWNDDNDRDGKRPASITILLKADGKQIESRTVTPDPDGNWSWSFTNLPKYRDHGTEIVYTIDEEPIAEYTTQVTGYNVTNTYKPETIDVEGTKTWNDDNDRDGKRPDSITIYLKADGKQIESRTVTPNPDGTWSWCFTNLPKYRDHGIEINYTIAEEPIEDYSIEIDKFNITNSYTPGKIAVNGTKTWDDDNDRDGLRPKSITIKLLADGKQIESRTVTPDPDGSWSWSFTNLPKYRDGGVEIDYAIEEVAVEEYSSVVEGFNVTNTHNPETIDVEGTKTWVDDNNRDGIRPEEITIKLLADGKEVKSTVVKADQDGSWSWSFTDLPKFRDHGTLIVYTIAEEEIDDYTARIDGYNVTNTHEPETVKVEGEKTWNDDNDRDGIRPESITIYLKADGKIIDTRTVKADKDGKWAWSFTNLLKYRDQGIKIVYTIEEASVTGYKTEIDGFNVTNTHKPETMKVEGEKTWNDDDDRDGIRPESITITLKADGKVVETKTVTPDLKGSWSWSFTNLLKYRDHGTEIVYTIEEGTVEGYTPDVDGFNVTNTHEPETVDVEGKKTWKDDNNRDGLRPDSIVVKLLADDEVIASAEVTPDKKGEWKWSFTDLPKYRDHGTEIVYSIEEEVVAHYSPAVNGYNITNTYSYETVSYSGKKTWIDNNDQDGKRPDTITVYLLADNVRVASRTVSAADGWAWSFDGLPKNRDGGIPIRYTLAEKEVEGYTSEVNGFNITNTHIPEKMNITVQKVWRDSENQDGGRPGSITVKLYADGVYTGDTLVLSNDNYWIAAYGDLDVYKDGEEIFYTIEEDVPDGYTAFVYGSAFYGFQLTNIRTVETIDIPVSKVWVDDNNRAGLRPESITAALFANGSDTGLRVELNEKNQWHSVFAGVAAKMDGTAIKYTVKEIAVDGYTSIVSGNAANGFIITNTSNAPRKISISIEKIWNDASNQDGVRPEYIQVKLLADGVDTGRIIALSAASGWKAEVVDLDETKDGKAIVYTVEELVPEGYTAQITGNASAGFEITNTRLPAKTDISGRKIWNDNSNRDGKRPDYINIHLWADDLVIASKRVTAADGWAWSFTGLDTYKNGALIQYRITEDAVQDYVTEYDGWNVINTLEVEELTSVAVRKVWDDLDNAMMARPAQVIVDLLANGKATGAVAVLNSSNNWASAFTALPVYDENGEAIVYTIHEREVISYTSSISGDAANGFVITNSYSEEFEDEEVPLSPPTNDGFLKLALTLAFTAAAFAFTSKKKKKAN